jgi:thiol:disulfide interchange protein
MLQKIALRFAFVLALLMPLAASASESDVPYSPQVVKDALAEGRAVLLDFAADW